MDQQAVERGSQPSYFYFFVVPIYEYLPLIGSVAAALWWALSTRPLALVGRLLGRQRLTPEEHGRLFGFVPFLIWWTVGTWAVYSYAGEKMGWLTTHVAIPMILLAGWLVGRLLRPLGTERWRAMWKAGGWGVAVLVPVLVAALARGLGPLLAGEFQLGDQEASSLLVAGQLLAALAVIIGSLLLIVRLGRRIAALDLLRNLALTFLALLMVMTVRTAWMASYVNQDTAMEWLVYAHTAPGVRQVMAEIQGISARLYNDPTRIGVAYGDDIFTVFYWYLRDFPNAINFGDSPNRNSLDAPIAIVGRDNWDQVDPYLRNQYVFRTYTYMWWPMEDYKGLTWERIKGALTDPAMRAALWDMLVNRDFARYSTVTGRDYTLASWPLRTPMRLYVRNDVAVQLWDFGAGPIAARQADSDPYQQNWLSALNPIQVVGRAGGGDGELQAPRGIDLGPDGAIYVADSGHHRVVVYDPNGGFLRSWGSFCNLAETSAGCSDPDGVGPLGLGDGQFNEPWGIAVAADGSVYVADTWNHRIQRFSPDGMFLGAWGQFGQAGPARFYGPRDVALGPDGRIYVTDTGNRQVQVFETDGRFVAKFGASGTQDAQMAEPVGLGFGPDGLLYIADTWNGQVDVYDAAFAHQRSWSVEAWFGQSTSNKPYLAADQSGRIYVTDPEMYRVLVFDGRGEYQYGFGQYSTETDGVALPIGIAVGADGITYVSDAGNSRIVGYRLP